MGAGLRTRRAGAGSVTKVSAPSARWPASLERNDQPTWPTLQSLMVRESSFDRHFTVVGQGLLLFFEEHLAGQRRSRKRIQTRNLGGPRHVGFDPSDRAHE